MEILNSCGFFFNIVALFLKSNVSSKREYLIGLIFRLKGVTIQASCFRTSVRGISAILYV